MTAKCGSCCRSCFRREGLLLAILLAVCLGVALGFAVRTANPSADGLMWIGLPGQLYLRSLRLMIVPLIICSVITGAASLDPKINGKISVISFIYIVVTNMLGAILGTLTWYIFQPGKNINYMTSGTNEHQTNIHTQDIIADMIRNIFPVNIFEATFRQDQTKYEDKMVHSVNTNYSINSTVTEMILTRYIGKTDGANLLGLIMACTLVGISAAAMKEKGKLFVAFFEAAAGVVTQVIRWFMWLTPIGVLSLIVATVADISDVGAIFRELGLFIAAVVVGLGIQQMMVLPLILIVLTRRNPIKHMAQIARPWIIAFAVASSAISIPEMFHSCEVHLKIDKRVSRFVIPFCVTLSGNGSAVFIVNACLFIANLTGNTPSVVTVLIVGLLVTVSCLAIPSIPSASIVTVVMLLGSIQIPIEAIALLLAVEFLLDRVRTTSSVTSNTICAAVTYHFCIGSLKIHDDGINYEGNSRQTDSQLKDQEDCV